MGLIGRGQFVNDIYEMLSNEDILVWHLLKYGGLGLDTTQEIEHL